MNNSSLGHSLRNSTTSFRFSVRFLFLSKLRSLLLLLLLQLFSNFHLLHFQFHVQISCRIFIRFVVFISPLLFFKQCVRNGSSGWWYSGLKFNIFKYSLLLFIYRLLIEEFIDSLIVFLICLAFRLRQKLNKFHLINPNKIDFFIIIWRKMTSFSNDKVFFPNFKNKL